MSEKLYAFLLRLFPSHFRQSYGEDALQLFRDRARHETGLPSRLRLWVDLLADLAISVPREYFYAQPELLSASTRSTSASPSFYVLNNDAPRPGALVFGFLLSFAALLTFSNLLNQGGQPRTLRASASSRRAFPPNPSKMQPRTAPQSADESSFTVAGQTAQQTSSSSSHADATCCAPSGQNSSSSSPSSAAPAASRFSKAAPTVEPTELNRPPNSSLSSNLSATARSQSESVDASERHRIITTAASNLKQYYAFPDVAAKMSDALLTHERRGDDNTAADGAALATLLTRQMREISNDKHLDLIYSSAPLPDHAGQPSPQEFANYRDFLLQNHCTVEKVELLFGNIGYLKLNSFPALAVCQQAAVAAMQRLNHARALIFDLRDNRGGEPDTVAFVAAYFFDHPEFLYNPRENTTSASWTHSPVPGNLLADKPLYILTSSRTYSGAEQFCYDLKMLKRATLVGEITGGGAHAGVFHRLDDHFGMGIPEAKPINPYGNADWAEVGVAPDVPVSAADALAAAQKLARAKLRRK